MERDLVDDRPGFLTRGAIPRGDGFVAVDEPEDAAKAASVDERTFAVVMTHNFLRDKEYLRSFPARRSPTSGCSVQRRAPNAC